MSATNYVLQGGDQGAARLRVLGRVMWPTTKQLLKRAGLKRGMRCLDVGCGSGEVSLRMARLVGSEGEVVGVDLDQRALELATLRARRHDLSARFQGADAAQLAEPASFDLVYARFLLSHLETPWQAVHRMLEALKPGGVLVVEDIDFLGHFCHPRCAAFDRYVELYQAAVRNRGADPTIGPRLCGMLIECGAQAVQVSVSQPVFREGEGKQIAPITLAHISPALVAAGLSSTDELMRTLAELSAFARDPRTLMSLPRVVQAWGRKAS